MKTLEDLVYENLDKTGKEIIDIMKYEEYLDNLKFQLKLKLIEDFNINGAYFKGKVGYNQYYFYKFTNFKILENKIIYCDVEKITFFLDKQTFKKEIEIFKELYEYYSSVDDERIGKDDWDKLDEYININYKFWDNFKNKYRNIIIK
jgi:hypothetical protein